jgi:hypothetical protein
MIIIYNFTNNPGFGDNIRGLISILQIKKKMNFDLYVSFKNHIFNNLFINEEPDYHVETHLEKITSDENPNRQNDLIMEFKECYEKFKCISVSTNVYPYENLIDDDIKKYLKKLFILKPETQDCINKIYKTLPENFNLYHYRIGDHAFGNIDNQYIEQVLNDILKQKPENAVFISDSMQLKNKILDFYNNKDVYIINSVPSHTMDSPNNVIDILADFFLITHAKCLYCFSNYHWISNFVHWSSIIYDIPLHNLKKN